MYLRKNLLRLCILSLVFQQINSLPAQNLKVYFGDLHQHSTLSFDTQSALPPAAAFNYAKGTANLSFMAITDHGNDLNNGNPAAGWQLLLAAASTASDSQFVALGSQEVGLVFGNGGYGHMVIHDSPHLADNDVFPDVRFNLDDFYNFIIARNSLAHFCHPGISGDQSSKFNNFAFDSRVDSLIYGLEILSGFRSTLYEKFYLLALAKGWHIGPVTGQDNHRGNYGDRIDQRNNINLTGVFLDTLSRSKLLDAFRNQRTYAFQASPASDRMFLNEFTADGNWMGDIFDNDDNVVNFTVSARAEGKFIAAHLYKNGHLLKRFEPNSNEFTWMVADSASFGSVYYFLKLIQEDTDVLWSSPIWVNSSGEFQPPENPITPISALRENFQNGLPRNLELTNITIRGVATVGRQFGFEGPGFLQDSTGGIAIFGVNFVEKVVPTVPFEFEVTGKVTFFNGQTELTPYTTKRVGIKTFPQALPVQTAEIASNGEAYEGRLVQVIGAEISGNFPPNGVNANITIDDGTGPCTLRIDKDTDIDGTPTPTGRVNIVGVVGQFDPTPPYDSSYQLIPRSSGDIEILTSVAGPDPETIPEFFSLSQNFPNPANPQTQIIFRVPDPAHISLKLFNMRGQKIRALVDELFQPGEYRITWDGLNDSGKEVASGIYLYKFEAPGIAIVKKLVLLR